MAKPNLNPQYYLASTASIASGGTSYALNNVLTLTGGTFTSAASILVTSVNGTGQITGIQIASAGVYSVVPTGLIVLSGGAGSGASLNGVWVAADPGSTTIAIYGSNTVGVRPDPTTLANRELFVNTAEALLITKNASGNLVTLGIDPQLALVYAIALG